MDSEDTRNTWITGIVCIAIITLSLGLFALWNSRTRLFIENGYTRQTLQGDSDTQWVLAEEK